MNEVFTLLKKNYPFLFATIVNLAVYCYQKYSSILNQIVKKLINYVGIVGLVFENFKDFKDHMQSEHWLPVLDQQLTSLSNSSSSIKQASDIDNFPASIEVHESAMKNRLMTFIIPNQNIEHDLFEFMTLKKTRFKIDIR